MDRVATFWFVVVRLLVDWKCEAGVLSGKAALQGVFEGEEIGEGKPSTGLVGSYKPEGVECRKSSFGSERTERQPSQGGKVDCSAASTIGLVQL